MPFGTLSGFTIGVTADRRSDEQASLIERRGGDVVLGPVIRTLPLAEEGATEAATEALIAQPADVVVLSTALGVRSWLSAAAGLGLEEALVASLGQSELIARGHKAVGAIAAAGLGSGVALRSPTYAAVIDVLRDRSTRHPDRRQVRVAVQLDGDGSGGLADHLATMGFDVVAVPVYRWHLPEDLAPAQRLVAAVAERRVDAVTFTSAHAVANFAQVADDLGRTDDVRAACASGAVAVACVGPVTAARARRIGLEGRIEPTQPRLGAMVQRLAASFEDRAIRLDLDGHPVHLQGRLVLVGDGEPVALTDRERSVLEVLSRKQGAVISKQALLTTVWRDEGDEHVVEVTVGRLRRRLGPAGAAIETVVRRGYRLAPT